MLSILERLKSKGMILQVQRIPIYGILGGLRHSISCAFIKKRLDKPLIGCVISKIDLIQKKEELI